MMSVLAGGICAGFLAYCVYFDRKRRSDPNFKTKLREKRLKEEIEKHEKTSQNDYPDLSTSTGLESFFVSEMQLGQQLLSTGDIENGTEHIAFAVLVTPNKEELLGFLSSQLPDDVFQMIVRKIPKCGEKLIKNAKLKTENSFKFDTMDQELIYEIQEEENEFNVE
jgi:import receptor subunit TOM20